MPELPEVEIHARLLRGWLAGRRIDDYEILDPKLMDGEDHAEWDAALRRGRVLDVGRQAKYLIIELEGEQTLVVHLRMTGKFVRDAYVAAPAARPTRLALRLDDGSRVRFEDFRRFGRTWLRPSGEASRLPELAELGPDALLSPTSPERLREITAGSRRAIKALLMDQRVIGGIGNICAAEILYRARVAPDAPAESLADDQVAAIARLTPEFLRWSIETQGRKELLYLGEPGAENVFTVYARAGQPCPRCETPIVRTVVAGRGTYHCPGCQR